MWVGIFFPVTVIIRVVASVCVMDLFVFPFLQINQQDRCLIVLLFQCISSLPLWSRCKTAQVSIKIEFELSFTFI